MKPSGVQLASAIVPPGRVTRTSSAAARRWSGANIEPKTDRAAVERFVGERDLLGVAVAEIDVDPLGRGTLTAPLEERGHVVDPGHDAAEAGGGDRGVAAPAGNVEHARAGVQVGRVSKAFGDRHDRRRDLQRSRRSPRSPAGVPSRLLDRRPVQWSWT